MQTLLSFGDSNTHGTKPMRERASFGRFPLAERWPGVARARLGADWTLIEEGLPGRTTGLDDPVMGAHMNGQTGLRIAIMSHAPFDVLTIMLGTNDCKSRFGSTPGTVAARIAGLLDIAQHPDMVARTGALRILLICPPPVEEAGVLADEFHGGRAVSLALPPLVRALAEARRVGFLDAGRIIGPDPIDGVHYDAGAHRALGLAVADAVAAL